MEKRSDHVQFAPNCNAASYQMGAFQQPARELYAILGTNIASIGVICAC